MPLRPCAVVGCPRLVRRGRCALHAQLHAAARRREPRRSVYGDPRWQKTRKRAIERAGGRCQWVEAGQRCPVTVRLHGHHDYVGGVEQMLVDGVDPFDERWIVVLCERHHGRLRARNHSIRR